MPKRKTRKDFFVVTNFKGSPRTNFTRFKSKTAAEREAKATISNEGKKNVALKVISAARIRKLSKTKKLPRGSFSTRRLNLIITRRKK